MTPRIVGLETEYALMALPHGPAAPAMAPAEAITELFRGTATQHRSHNRFLANGGRLYVDIGSHPEYATAECSNARDAALQDRAGELMLQRMLEAANERLDSHRLHLLKTNTDSGDATFGCHENYQVKRETLDPLDPGFVAFLVARTVLSAGGGLDKSGAYVLSPRAFHIHRVQSADPTRLRPMISTRDEPHADPAAFARLQVTFGDSTMSDAATEIRLRLTSAVLDMIEGGVSLCDLALADPIASLHDCSRHGPAAILALRSGGAVSALDLLDTVVGRCEAAGIDSLLDIRDMIDRMQGGEQDTLSPSVDWICKKLLLTEAADRYGPSDPRIPRLNLAFHDLDPRRGLADRLRASGAMSALPLEDVERAVSTPPSDTRAALRGRFIAEATRLERAYSVSWTHIRLDSPPHPQIDLLNASQCSDSRVADLVDVMATTPAPPMSRLARLRAGLGPLHHTGEEPPANRP